MSRKANPNIQGQLKLARGFESLKIEARPNFQGLLNQMNMNKGSLRK